MMIDISHGDMVARLAKDGGVIRAELTSTDCHKLHMAMGVAGEAGEAVDLIKKSVFYRKTLDTDKLLEELGDLEFYLEGLRQAAGVTREQVLHANKLKLSKRYTDFDYSDEAAIERADKQ